MDSVAGAAVVEVESAIAGKRLALLETPKESPAQTVPIPLLEGITRRGPEFLQQTASQHWPAATLGTPLPLPSDTQLCLIPTTGSIHLSFESKNQSLPGNLFLTALWDRLD